MWTTGNDASRIEVIVRDASPVSVMPTRLPLSAGMKTANCLAVLLPFLGLAAAPFFVWGWGFGWTDLGLLLGLYLLSAFGITVGFHRLFTHRSFETNSIVKFVLAACGSMAVQGPLLKWVAIHRIHHQHSDAPDDPHSPHQHDGGLWGLLCGMWHAHMGWFFQPDPVDLPGYVADLRKSRALRAANALFPVWVVIGLLIPAVLGGLLTMSWAGVWTGVIWGGFVRIFIVHHVTWSVNSACHLWGSRTYPNADESRDNLLFGVLAMGEGWHNSHHAFPTSARHGLKWWQIDVSYWVIRGLVLVGLAWNMRLPPPQMNKKRASKRSSRAAGMSAAAPIDFANESS
jgi:stearoyl-CoA desaturase (Delta-9 desaturase)